MTRFRYYTASSLDGFLADDDHDLSWLLTQPEPEGGPLAYDDFIADVGVLVMGYSTYQWVVDHLDQAGADGDWPYSLPSVVLTHRDLEPIAESIRVATGPPQEHRALLEELAGGKDAWIVGGGDVAAQFADAGMLQEVIVWFAPVLLGSGKPLFTGRQELELQEAGHNGAFLCARYAVTGGDRSNR